MKKYVAALVLAVSLVSGAAQATVIGTTYTNAADFMTASGATNLIDFNSISGDFVSQSSPWAYQGVTFSGGALQANYQGLYGSEYVFAYPNITMSFAPGTAFAGADFMPYYGNGGYMNVTACGSLGSTISLGFSNNGTQQFFVGFSGSAGEYITSIISDGGSGSNYGALDNVVFSDPIEAPAPGALALLGLGLFGIGGLRRNKAKVAA